MVTKRSGALQPVFRPEVGAASLPRSLNHRPDDFTATKTEQSVTVPEIPTRAIQALSVTSELRLPS